MIQTWDHNNFVSDPTVAENFCTLQQQFEAFIQMYKEDRTAKKRRQQELLSQLEALSLTISAARTEAVRGKNKGKSAKELRGDEATDGRTLSLSIAAARPSANASKDDSSCMKGMDDQRNRELNGNRSAYDSTCVPNPKYSKWDFPKHIRMSDLLGGLNANNSFGVNKHWKKKRVD